MRPPSTASLASGTPTAAIIIIGNEILSGRTADRNVPYIATQLTAKGILLKHVAMIPDEAETIAANVRHWSSQVTYVFTTGGIGSTHDDITAQSIADAFGTRLILHDEARLRLLAHYGDQINDARLRMALIPEGAALIDNPVSVAPGFRLHNVFVMAGVPEIAHAMLDMILPSLENGRPWIVTTIRTLTAESYLASPLAEIQKRFSSVEIGSYPYFRQGGYGVSLVIKGYDPGEVEAAAQEIQKAITDLKGTWSREDPNP